MLELVRIGRQKRAGALEARGRRLEILQSRLRACFFQQRQKREAFLQRVRREVRRQRRGQLQNLLVPLQAIQRLAEIDPHAQYFPRRKRCRRLARDQAEQSFSVGEATGLQLDAPSFGKGRGCGCAIVIQIRDSHGLEQRERGVAIFAPPRMHHGDLAPGLYGLGEVLLLDGLLPRLVQMRERLLGIATAIEQDAAQTQRARAIWGIIGDLVQQVAHDGRNNLRRLAAADPVLDRLEVRAPILVVLGGHACSRGPHLH